MARRLDVYLLDSLAGLLTQDEHGEIGFQYAESWLATPHAIPLSQSLPLRAEAFTRRECAGFFGGILPEGEKRQIIARNLGISAKNDFAMLEEIGGDCAGAVTFLPSGAIPARQEASYRVLSEAELAGTLRQLPRRPLLAGERHMRLSLAGAQDKLAVLIEEDRISLPLDGAPSTHIIKPAIPLFEGMVVNEYFCMQLASAIGLPTAKVARGGAEEVDYLIVERYDRSREAPPCLERIHQEDFCQALGVTPERKYEAEGGPSFSDCAELLRKVSTSHALDTLRFTDGFIFNFLIGNNDAHGKNFALLYSGWPHKAMRVTLAPLYDLVCTSYYPELSTRMAMKIGSEYKPDRVYPRHFDRLADAGKLNKPAVRRRVVEIARLTLSRLPDVRPEDGISKDIAEIIRKKCERVVGMFTQ